MLARSAALLTFKVIALVAFLAWLSSEWSQRLRAQKAAALKAVAEIPPPKGIRAVEARTRVEPGLRELCHRAGLAYPPGALFLRAFKHEATLEVWARNGDLPYQLLLTLPITCGSGLPGPKRKEGDLQVPEGFYEVNLFNPDSSFHLSMRVNYPNASDRVLSDPAAPGSDIYIHGKNCSVGCLPLGDANIEQLYILALDTQRGGALKLPIHIFPARMVGPKWESWALAKAASNPDLARFWRTLQPGFEAFERTHQVPQVQVTSDGSYLLAE